MNQATVSTSSAMPYSKHSIIKLLVNTEAAAFFMQVMQMAFGKNNIESK